MKDYESVDARVALMDVSKVVGLVFGKVVA